MLVSGPGTPEAERDPLTVSNERFGLGCADIDSEEVLGQYVCLSEWPLSTR